MFQHAIIIRYTYTELFLLLTIRVAVFSLYRTTLVYIIVFSIIQKLHKTRSHYWYILQQKHYFSFETQVFSVFNFSQITAHWLQHFTHASYKVLPTQSALCRGSVLPQWFLDVQTTRLMAQENLPSCDQTSVNHSISQYEKLLLQKGTPVLKRLR